MVLGNMESFSSMVLGNTESFPGMVLGNTKSFSSMVLGNTESFSSMVLRNTVIVPSHDSTHSSRMPACATHTSIDQNRDSGPVATASASHACMCPRHTSIDQPKHEEGRARLISHRARQPGSRPPPSSTHSVPLYIHIEKKAENHQRALIFFFQLFHKPSI